MRKLTTLRKITIYKKALEKLITDNDCKHNSTGGFCYYISAAACLIKTKGVVPSFSIHEPFRSMSKTWFPELFKYEPKKLVVGFYDEDGTRAFWFNALRGDGMVKRIEILQTIIAELEASL
jgi:hypothetical protein